ncbi:hypothetical protein [Neisseria canis]|uniref:Uncharacterized protein n=1 Tax=Neisseria canis TaxID=493 RepID=A0A1X3CZ57_9NEIS|nr:hypothetical protein [Neisseria canis]OSI12963.1 hypothetical protein BWD07_02510 [Neisseria canis]VEF02405.1 Uncharacterised protein [Neisseria canis]
MSDPIFFKDIIKEFESLYESAIPNVNGLDQQKFKEKNSYFQKYWLMTRRVFLWGLFTWMAKPMWIFGIGYRNTTPNRNILCHLVNYTCAMRKFNLLKQVFSDSF